MRLFLVFLRVCREISHLVTGVGQVVNLRADWLSAQLARLTIGAAAHGNHRIARRPKSLNLPMSSSTTIPSFEGIAIFLNCALK